MFLGPDEPQNLCEESLNKRSAFVPPSIGQRSQRTGIYKECDIAFDVNIDKTQARLGAAQPIVLRHAHRRPRLVPQYLSRPLSVSRSGYPNQVVDSI